MAEWTSRPHELKPAGAMQWQRHIENLYEYAEGPVWFWLVPKGELPDARFGSRDLALEAFENGHPHICYAGGAL